MTAMLRRVSSLLVAVVALSGWAFAQQQSVGPTSCEVCHSNTDWFDEEGIHIVREFQRDVHAGVGLACHSCHGGNPDPELADDMEAAMDPGFESNPYIGVPEESEIPEFCGKCHSSLAFMRRFKPDARVDQVQEYWTSQHGRSLLQGDVTVATCEDCHGVHGILRVTDPESKVYPTKVAATCSGCHSDPETMAGYEDDHGQPLRVDQVARWERSVHANAMYTKGDLSAPTCNDCHGNHGATPPGVESIAFVCGQCHGRESELFRASAKQDAFEMHNTFLEDGTGCESCHDELPEHVISNVHRFSECVTCHENHAVVRPTIAFLGNLPDTPCAFCHEPSTAVEEPAHVREHFEQVRNDLLEVAAAAGLQGEERFDWLVDQAQILAPHTFIEQDDETPQLRPQFARLFQKFRIGKTTYTYEHPVSGEQIVAQVRQCNDCHVDEDSAGARTARAQLESMRQIIGLTARAERILLAAQRGGVETRIAQEALDAAVDSQIELEVLVHTFDAEGEFASKYEEGGGHASTALQAGVASLDELAYRRGGLFAALAVIVLMLVALGLKIRQLSHDE